jgi:dihydroorotate dehydrogenase
MDIKSIKCVVSPPFGHYIRFNKRIVPIRGTFTIDRRLGIIKNALSTFRRDQSRDGWVNRMGLVNVGINNILPLNPDHIYSITAFNEHDWQRLFELIHSYIVLELNVSCPNEKEPLISRNTIEKFIYKYDIIVKLPSNDFNETLEKYEHFRQLGITNFHIGNTIKVKEGGLSGREIQKVSLPIIEQIKERDTRCFIIGGGGIYSPEDVKRYRNAGADAFSLATIFMTPWKVPAVLKEIYKYNKPKKISPSIKPQVELDDISKESLREIRRRFKEEIERSRY